MVTISLRERSTNSESVNQVEAEFTDAIMGIVVLVMPRKRHMKAGRGPKQYMYTAWYKLKADINDTEHQKAVRRAYMNVKRIRTGAVARCFE